MIKKGTKFIRFLGMNSHSLMNKNKQKEKYE